MNIINLQYMDNTKGIQKIQHMYDKLTYFDSYSNSVILFIIISIIFFFACSYCFVMINITPIKNDWTNQKCKPYIIPFAGLINKPDNMSISDFTKQNFEYCTQNILKDISGFFLKPITFIISSITKVIDSIKKSLNSIRGMTNKIRNNFQKITQEIMGRIMNIMIPLQQIIISFRDSIGKIQGTMSASLFTLLGSYYTLKSLMGAIAEFIIIILIALASMIALFWILPFTWGLAASNTALFTAVAIPMALILTFMKNVLKVQSNLSIPSIKCFDKNTLILMNNNTNKKIIDINVGDILLNNVIVTAKIKVITKGSQMYNLNGIIVSDSHILKYNSKWIKVSEHPESKIIENYTEPYLYCLNTNSKQIIINDYIFTDWDELYNDDISKINKNYNKQNTQNTQNNKINEQNIHQYLDSGFNGNTLIHLKNGQFKKIKDILVEDILEKGEKVYGIVEINGLDINQYSIENIYGSNLNLYNSTLLKNLDLDKKNIIQNKKQNEIKLYNLLTNTKTFNIYNIKFYDYNSSIDLFLNK
jgi:hypothetical protein